MIGSPIVFHTAPPQPASKARMTWYAVLVGGPEASQKGFGDRTPQKLMLRSGMGPPALHLEHLVNARRSLLAMSHRVHHLASAVYAIPTGKIFRVAGAHGGVVNGQTPVLQFQSGDLLQEFSFSLLPQRLDHHVNFQPKLCSRHGRKGSSSARILGAFLCAHAFQRRDVSSAVIYDLHR